MKPEIKQRIEQIKAGQVPDGYKKTKIGVVPLEWEIRQGGEIFAERNECHNANLQLLSITAEKGIIPRSDIDGKDTSSADKSKYKKICVGDIGYNTMRMWQGVSAFSSYEGIVSPAYTILSPMKHVNAKYYSYLFKLQNVINVFYRNSQGLVDDTRSLKYDWFKIIDMPYPPLAEQEKIVKILSVQDRIIELYQRKIEELQKMKKIYLSKMFPKKGENAPEWRFPQFTTPWEQRKLGEIGKARSGIGFPDSEQGGKEGIPFYKVSDMNLDGNEIEMTVANNYVSTEQIARKKWSPLEDVPAIYFAKVGAAVMLNRKRLCRKPFLFDNNTMAYSLNVKYWNTEFAKAEFSKIDLTRLVQVGALPSYNANDVDAISIVLPSLEEQQKIGAYFANLDNLITFHQRKLEETKKYKKALMQLLLTGIVRCE